MTSNENIDLAKSNGLNLISITEEMTMTEITYWIDRNDNKWNADKFTLEEAIEYSKSLVNCHSCTDCIECQNCSNCVDCKGCFNCYLCEDCVNCEDCSQSESLMDCDSCNKCYNLCNYYNVNFCAG